MRDDGKGGPRDALDWIYESALFVFGLACGSFLNVCISRIPRDQSVVTPSSHCPICGAWIGWRDNIPLFSWILLHGRCRDCRGRISLRYPAVELLTAALFAACYARFGPGWLTLKFCVFAFLLVGLLFMDAETSLLPREFTYTGIVLGIAFAPIAPTDSSATRLLLHAYGAHLTPVQVSFLDAMLGALLGVGFFLLAAGLYFLLRKQPGMGAGDFPLIAMSGLFLGLKLTVLVIFLAPLTASIYALALIVRYARSGAASMGEILHSWEIPFGVFVSACSLATAFFGEAIWRWYVGFY